jgi:hypothetical protein
MKPLAILLAAVLLSGCANTHFSGILVMSHNMPTMVQGAAIHAPADKPEPPKAEEKKL